METVELKDDRKYCVYLITNLVNGKQYAGQTGKGLSVRWSCHKSFAKSGVETYLYNAIRLYGVENFVVCVFRERLSRQEANEEEKLLIRSLCLSDPKIGYNMTIGGEGTIPNEETRKRMIENSGYRRRDIDLIDVVSMYESGLSLERIGEKLGTNRTTIKNRLLEAGKGPRSLSEAQIMRRPLRPTNEQLVDLYRQGKSFRQISAETGMPVSSLRSRLKKIGEPSRSCSEGKILRHGKGLDDMLILELRKTGKSIGEIAKQFNVNSSTIERRIKRTQEMK